MRGTLLHAQRMQHSRLRRRLSTGLDIGVMLASVAHMRNGAIGRMVAALAIVLTACLPAPQAAPSSPSQPAAATFVVPRPTEERAAQTTLTGTSFSHPDIERELKSYFELFYKARTLPRRGPGVDLGGRDHQRREGDQRADRVLQRLLRSAVARARATT